MASFLISFCFHNVSIGEKKWTFWHLCINNIFSRINPDTIIWQIIIMYIIIFFFSFLSYFWLLILGYPEKSWYPNMGGSIPLSIGAIVHLNFIYNLYFIWNVLHFCLYIFFVVILLSPTLHIDHPSNNQSMTIIPGTNTSQAIVNVPSSTSENKTVCVDVIEAATGYVIIILNKLLHLVYNWLY